MTPAQAQQIPEAAMLASFGGVGNPTALAKLNAGGNGF